MAPHRPIGSAVDGSRPPGTVESRGLMDELEVEMEELRARVKRAQKTMQTILQSEAKTLHMDEASEEHERVLQKIARAEEKIDALEVLLKAEVATIMEYAKPSMKQ